MIRNPRVFRPGRSQNLEMRDLEMRDLKMRDLKMRDLEMRGAARRGCVPTLRVGTIGRVMIPLGLGGEAGRTPIAQA
jgi:hypothetical protein